MTRLFLLRHSERSNRRLRSRGISRILMLRMTREIPPRAALGRDDTLNCRAVKRTEIPRFRCAPRGMTEVSQLQKAFPRGKAFCNAPLGSPFGRAGTAQAVTERVFGRTPLRLPFRAATSPKGGGKRNSSGYSSTASSAASTASSAISSTTSSSGSVASSTSSASAASSAALAASLAATRFT